MKNCVQGGNWNVTKGRIRTGKPPPEKAVGRPRKGKWFQPVETSRILPIAAEKPGYINLRFAAV